MICTLQIQTVNGESAQLLLLRSTTGFHSRYVGNWSHPSSIMWQKIDGPTRQQVQWKSYPEARLSQFRKKLKTQLRDQRNLWSQKLF